MGLFDKIFRRPAAAVEAAPSRLAELAAEFPFPITAHHGASVEADLLAGRAAGPDPRGLPVIIGDYHRAARILDMWEEPHSLPGQVSCFEGTDFLKWIEARRPEILENDGLDHQRIYPAGSHPLNSLSIGTDPKGQPFHEVFIAYLPAGELAMAPIHLRFGEWNACPAPFTHAAAARFWAPRYGASIATLTCDVIEYEVTRPPESEAEALELAWQQYLYCPDIVAQRAGSVATLAKILRESSRWYFWWD